MTGYYSRSIISRCKRSGIITAGLVVAMLSASSVFAAVGCTLNDPDRDVRRLFPESTGYRTAFISIKEKGGEGLYRRVEKNLGDTFDSVYETIDVPYAFYDVLKGKDTIAYIHGVNQKATYGGMQLIIATDLSGKIIAFYYQKMSSPEAKKFMDKSFTQQFVGLTLADFMKGNLAINDPSEQAHDDFKATLRGLKKNLILFDELRLDKPVGALQ